MYFNAKTRRNKCVSTLILIVAFAKYYYFTNDRGSCEVDFVIDNDEQVIPVEVKAEVNLKAKSLKTYYEKFDPKTSIRTSMADYKEEEWLTNLPLYAIENLP